MNLGVVNVVQHFDVSKQYYCNNTFQLDRNSQ